MTNPKEIWKIIDWSKGCFEVSNQGNFRRIKPSKIRHYGFIKNRLIKTVEARVGYRRFSAKIDGKHYYEMAHRVVARHFIGAIPKGKQVNHKNGIRFDNRAENLEYVTPSQNLIHASRILKSLGGENQWKSKLTDEQVKEMRKTTFKYGIYSFFARKFGVSPATARKAMSGIGWKHI